jgi:hypothetical protein
MDVTVCSVSGQLSMSAVRRSAMVIDAGILPNSFGEQPFIDVPSREVRVPEVGCLIRVIKIKLVRFSNLIIFRAALQLPASAPRQKKADLRCFPLCNTISYGASIDPSNHNSPNITTDGWWRNRPTA